ncbi:T5SS/PEP-CTERM-associated repeat-containing protein [Pseudovibrio sp. Tun.PSC04-5.I4]|nr:T5SS/PEP-CTERM-associated repeat-containing protein [Pseudovibrio sp. Tun.PSC04-5.I4]
MLDLPAPIHRTHLRNTTIRVSVFALLMAHGIQFASAQSKYIQGDPVSVSSTGSSDYPSLWTAGTFVVGNSSSGSLRLENGGQVAATGTSDAKRISRRYYANTSN